MRHPARRCLSWSNPSAHRTGQCFPAPTPTRGLPRPAVRARVRPTPGAGADDGRRHRPAAPTSRAAGRRTWDPATDVIPRSSAHVESATWPQVQVRLAMGASEDQKRSRSGKKTVLRRRQHSAERPPAGPRTRDHQSGPARTPPTPNAVIPQPPPRVPDGGRGTAAPAPPSLKPRCTSSRRTATPAPA